MLLISRYTTVRHGQYRPNILGRVSGCSDSAELNRMH